MDREKELLEGINSLISELNCLSNRVKGLHKEILNIETIMVGMKEQLLKNKEELALLQYNKME